MAEAFFVGDGYDTDGKIPRADGIHPELTFRYRPATRDQRDRFVRAQADAEKRAKVTADLIVAHVQEWSVVDRSGFLVDKPTADVVAKLQPVLVDKLVDIIIGYAASGQDGADRKN